MISIDSVMIKSVKRIAALLIGLLLVVTVISTTRAEHVNVTRFDGLLSEKKNSDENSKTSYNVDELPDFADNLVTVSIEKEATWGEYSTANFADVRAVNIIELTSHTSEWVKKTEMRVTTNIKMLIDIEKYRRIFSIELPIKSKENVLIAIEILQKRSDIEIASPSYCQEEQSVESNDRYRNNQWGIENANVKEAWHLATGSSSVTVGVLDSGIDSFHPDLINRVHRGIPHNTNTTLHRDFTTDVEIGVPVLNPLDPRGHGTHVAGIIGAHGNNDTGIAGVAWDVRLVSLRVFNSEGRAEGDNWLINAIDYAASVGIPILNYSGSTSDFNETLKTKIESYSGLFVTTSGNTNSDNDGLHPRYPGSFRLNNLISVGSITSNNERSPRSNWGENTVDIWAPGKDIFSTYPETLCIVGGCDNPLEENYHIANGYHSMSGTSMAAPYVAGVAALMLSVNPTLTAQQLRTNLIENSNLITFSVPDSSKSGATKQITVRKLNARMAVRAGATFDTKILSDNTIEIRGTFGKQLSGAVTIPGILNGRSVATIASSAFSGQTKIFQINIPTSIKVVGTNAFLNTNQAKIYFPDRTSVPETFSSSWNPSSNPVYFGTNLCNHSSKSTHEKDNNQHWDFCYDCRTYVNITNHQFYTSGDWQYCHYCSYSLQVPHTHNYTHSYENLGNTHRLHCECGSYQQGGHVGMPDNIGDRYVLCFQCKYLIDTNKYFISLIMRAPINLNDCDCEDDLDHYHDINSMMISEADIFLNRKTYIVEPENTNA